MSLSKTMRAMVLEEPDGPLELREVQLPVPGEDEVLLRVRACAVDRFDIAIRKGGIERATLPHVLGHEIAGEVSALGSGVEGWAPGDRVATTLYLVCGECRRCKGDRETICENFGGHIGVNTWGGYAEYTLMPAHNLVRLPESIDFPEASVLANAVGTPYHALVSRMGIGEGDFLIVTGAGGGVGLHAVQIGVMRGARVMGVDIGAHKHEAILAQGAEHAVGASALPDLAMEWTDGRGVDGVLELVGTATMPHTFASLAKGGQMVIVGSHTGTAWEIDTGLIYRKELEIRGSRNVSAAELQTVVDLVADGKLTPIIAGTFPLEEAEALQARVADGSAVGREVLVP
ncbi:MAG: alcohol dehydrogenase catalytic domain-containing protein [Acidimicrobiia bacterium]|nr:alcohol dehydrogenase catalytic domain-containing protein [Acidimicrobiia bacterium]